jgi:hypothetical protein
MRKANLKKLYLARETIATLQSVDVSDVHGGVMYTGCDSACTQCTGGPRTKTLVDPTPTKTGTDTVVLPTIGRPTIIR